MLGGTMKFLRNNALLVVPAVLLLVNGCQLHSAKSNNRTVKISASTQKSKQESIKRTPVRVRGIYLTGWTAGTKRFHELVNLVDKTELNAMVIDIKDTDGVISYKSNIPLAKKYNLSFAKMDPAKVMPVLKEHNIYSIARIACFKDPELAKKRPDLAIQTTSGGLWRDRGGSPWLNPYKKENWEYIAAIAKEAAAKGFNEIQLDYVRFASEGKMSSAVFPGKTKEEPTVVIDKFTQYLRKELEPSGVWFAADIFGLTALVHHDMGIGQKIGGIAANVDYICPMVYPSHYHLGEYGIPNPDLRPYKTVWLSIRDAKVRIKETHAKVRPWLQDFSLQSHYGPDEVRKQMQAVYDNGIGEWILWNPRNRYTASALRTDAQAAKLDRIQVRGELLTSEMTAREKAAAQKRAEAKQAGKSEKKVNSAKENSKQSDS
jgi:hypothetical protein